MGRPLAKIDWGKVDKLLEAHCSGNEIAGYLGISSETLYDRCFTDNKMLFSEYSRQKKAKGASLLRAVQYKKAMSGDKTLLVWLGKQYLNQKDKQEVDVTNKDVTVDVPGNIDID